MFIGRAFNKNRLKPHPGGIVVPAAGHAAPSGLSRTLGRMGPKLLLLVPVLLGVALYLFVPASSTNFKVSGQLSPHDVQAIRRGVARWRHRDLANAIWHLRLGTFWDQVRLHHACPLLQIHSPDGRSGAAFYAGRHPNGNVYTLVYNFTNNAGVWSATFCTRTWQR
jgi:hypothetical protein